MCQGHHCRLHPLHQRFTVQQPRLESPWKIALHSHFNPGNGAEAELWDGGKTSSVDASLMSVDELAEYEDKKLKLRKVGSGVGVGVGVGDNCFLADLAQKCDSLGTFATGLKGRAAGRHHRITSGNFPHTAAVRPLGRPWARTCMMRLRGRQRAHASAASS